MLEFWKKNYVFLFFILVFFSWALVMTILYDKNKNNRKIYKIKSRKLQPKNAFEYIDRIYYINLDKREDRRQEMKKQFKELEIPTSKIQRIPGIVDKFGALGCSKSHLNVLLEFKKQNFNNCLILEDDFDFIDKKQTLLSLQTFFEYNIQWDAIVLSGNIIRSAKTKPHTYPYIKRLFESETTSGYMIHKNFVDVAIKNFQEGISSLEKCKGPTHGYCIDIYWKKIQGNHRWYVFDPILGKQRESYSDIEQKNAKYLW